MRYLGPKKRDKVVALYHFDPDTNDAKDFWLILQALNVIIRIINSWREEVDLAKFGPYVRQTHEKMHTMFPEIWDNGKNSFFFTCFIESFNVIYDKLP